MKKYEYNAGREEKERKKERKKEREEVDETAMHVPATERGGSAVAKCGDAELAKLKPCRVADSRLLSLGPTSISTNTSPETLFFRNSSLHASSRHISIHIQASDYQCTTISATSNSAPLNMQDYLKHATRRIVERIIGCNHNDEHLREVDHTIDI